MLRVIALIATVVALLFNPLTLGVLGGIAWHSDFQKATLIEHYEDRYAEVCPKWRDSSTWDRWFDSTISRYSWCSDYIERL